MLLATMALLPPMLQNLIGYPIITVGLVLAPRGIGTMIAMMVVGRLVGKIDPRLLVGFGLSLTALSLWQMTAFAIGMDYWPLITSGVIQGFGLGFVFIPLSTVAFQTLEPQLRTEASGLFNLIRNIGSAIGISIMAALLTANMQINHADLAAEITPVQSEPAGPRHRPDAADDAGRRPDRGAARRPDHAAVADDRLSRRFQGDVPDHALFAAPAAPAALPQTGRGASQAEEEEPALAMAE